MKKRSRPSSFRSSFGPLDVCSLAERCLGSARGSDDLGRSHLACSHMVRPAETSGIITPFMVLLRPATTPCEAAAGPADDARAWRNPGACSPDGLVYEFVLRKGVKFPQRDEGPSPPRTVKFSFERYRGRPRPRPLRTAWRRSRRRTPGASRPSASSGPWPDFMTFLYRRHRRQLDRAEEVRREGG